MTKIQRKIEETEKRLQFTIVLGLFFPVLLEALMSLNGSEEKVIAETILKSGLLIFLLIANYLVFEWRKNNLSDRSIDYLTWCYITTITCYGLVFLFLAFMANGNLKSFNFFTEFIYGGMLVGTMYIPVISFGIIILELSFRKFKEISGIK